MQIIKEIREETGIPFEFWSYCRLDLLRAQTKMVDMIGEIGWTSFTFGIETFNKASGSAVGKGANPEKLKEFLISLRERYPEHKFQINIIIGLPSDTEEDAITTTQWFIDNPTVATNLRIRELNIHNAVNKKTASLISQDPGKYGYTIIGNVPRDPTVVRWMTKTGLTIEQAHEIANKMQAMYNTAMGDQPLQTATSMQGQILEVDETGMVHNAKKQLVKNYIRNKRRFRGV